MEKIDPLKSEMLESLRKKLTNILADTRTIAINGLLRNIHLYIDKVTIELPQEKLIAMRQKIKNPTAETPTPEIQKAFCRLDYWEFIAALQPARTKEELNKIFDSANIKIFLTLEHKTAHGPESKKIELINHIQILLDADTDILFENFDQLKTKIIDALLEIANTPNYVI